MWVLKLMWETGPPGDRFWIFGCAGNVFWIILELEYSSGWFWITFNIVCFLLAFFGFCSHRDTVKKESQNE